MRSFPVKLVAVFVLLGLGIYLTTSTLLPHGDNGRKSVYHVFDCRGVLRKIKARKDGNCGCENLETVKLHKLVPSRSLRGSYFSPPPPPIKNKQKAMSVPTPPPNHVV